MSFVKLKVTTPSGGISHFTLGTGDDANITLTTSFNSPASGQLVQMIRIDVEEIDIEGRPVTADVEKEFKRLCRDVSKGKKLYGED